VKTSAARFTEIRQKRVAERVYHAVNR
jgi:hypothetical protein